jgi:hypothetical protein
MVGTGPKRIEKLEEKKVKYQRQNSPRGKRVVLAFA